MSGWFGSTWRPTWYGINRGDWAGKADGGDAVGRNGHGDDHALVEWHALDVGVRAFQMSANNGFHAVLMQPRAQIHFGGLQLSEQRPPSQFNNIKAASIYGLSSASGCLKKRV
jgi:hypothetical protein